ncbi:Purine nucleoside phosphorylase [Scheffersomyces spartinae]|uniref:Purine nucleoside phosphorylase n=1 Tax=Scheffersomyces spartinae TaxID=45513 RepID=A0A9P8AI29_9ASCO|nr:Purine nucleoside phosphorylase [Scheffersomyces spartinae]KAG7193305.1 Purine nucleoside phosphorylase [Scheffersomyces spartinae]
MPQDLTELEQSCDTLRQKISSNPKLANPRVMIICGSGLGGIASVLDPVDKIEVLYSEIPGFRSSTVPGHAGKLVFGLIGPNKVPVMCMVGRLHYYEGYSFDDTTFPIRVASLLGITTCIVTNAAGGLNSSYSPGHLMIINDHINLPGLAGAHPLRGPNMDLFGPRFLPTSDAYDLELRKLFVRVSREQLKLTRPIHEGTYAFVLGPTFESRAESRLLRTLGADAVGMSTVAEVIVARHSGLKVLALSLITNAVVTNPPASVWDEKPVPLDQGMASHAEVLEAADEASKDVQKIIELVVNEL